MATPQIKGAIITAPVGSRVTCRPVPKGADEDFLVLLWSIEAKSAIQDLLAAGWSDEGDSDRYGGGPLTEVGLDPDSSTSFVSLRKGDQNLVVTANQEFFQRFLAATHVAKRLNLLKKSDRISLFQAVLYGNAMDPEVAEELQRP